MARSLEYLCMKRPPSRAGDVFEERLRQRSAFDRDRGGAFLEVTERAGSVFVAES
jgi:hypothetical protein